MIRIALIVAMLLAFAAQSNLSGAAQAEPSVAFTFAQGTSAEDEAIVRVGVTFAREFFASEFDVTLDGPFTVDVRGTQQYDVIAHTAPGAIFIATGAMGWHYAPPLRKLQIVIHEYVHLIHWQLDPASTSPLWLIEGSAEYLAWHAIDRLGLLDLAITRDFWIGNMHANPALQGVLLSSMEQPSLNASGSLYEIGAYAVSQLVDRAGIEALFAYFALDTEMSRADAFTSSFGINVQNFYSAFESTRASASPTGYDVTPLLFPWYPSPETAPVADANAWPNVDPGGLSLVRARTSPGTSCTLRFIDPNGQTILEQQMRANSDGSIFWFWELEDLTVTGDALAEVTCGVNTITAAIVVGTT